MKEKKILSILTAGLLSLSVSAGASAASVNYAAANWITSAATQTGKTYASSTANESALIISTTENVTIKNPTVTKTGSSSGGDDCNFYGLNAAVLAKDGADVTIAGGTIQSSASGANGIFCYGGNGGQNGASGDGTTVTVSDTTITTTGSGSGGIMTTGGGVMKASNLTVTTSGASSAAIRTDRGGGTVTVSGGTYTSKGLGSPAIYSTAKVSVSDAALVSTLSEGVCIEGKNSINLTNCTLTANNTQCNGHATFLDTVMIYQSMSGDASSGTSSFKMTGGTLNSKNGHMFHVTNTTAAITLKDVTLVNGDSGQVILSVCDDGWSGASNIAVLNAVSQKLSGTMLVGSDSNLTLNLSDGSSFTGTIHGKISNSKGSTVSTSVGKVAVTLDSTSTWTLTADTYISSFSGQAAHVISNGYTLYVNGTALTGTTEGEGDPEDTAEEEEEEETIAISDCTISGVKAKTYTGKAITLSLTVKHNGTKLTEGTDYTVSYKNNKAVGTAAVTIKGKGNYTGKVQKTFTIRPKAAVLSALKAGTEKLTVQWDKVSGVSGYEIQYSLKKDFSDAEKISAAKASTTKKVLKNLTAGKRYYVRIRTYKKVDGEKVYSVWSDALNAKTEK